MLLQRMHTSRCKLLQISWLIFSQTNQKFTINFSFDNDFDNESTFDKCQKKRSYIRSYLFWSSVLSVILTYINNGWHSAVV